MTDVVQMSTRFVSPILLFQVSSRHIGGRRSIAGDGGGGAWDTWRCRRRLWSRRPWRGYRRRRRTPPCPRRARPSLFPSRRSKPSCPGPPGKPSPLTPASISSRFDASAVMRFMLALLFALIWYGHAEFAACFFQSPVIIIRAVLLILLLYLMESVYFQPVWLTFTQAV